ncbi:MAG: DUF364 domain-containing protein [Syntrophobacterales bacterium]
MEILQALLDSLAIDVPVTAGVVGAHLMAVASQRLGLAAHLPSQGQSDAADSEKGVGILIGKRACDLASWLLEDHLVRAGIGMAALNSVLEIDYQALIEVNAKKIIADRAIGKNLMVVGHFPFIGQLRSKVRNLWVMEKEPRGGDLCEEEGYQALAEADVVAITGSCLINHTFDRIMANCKPGSFKIMLGPSTPLSTILLDCGLDVIGGALVEEKSTVLRMVEKGAAFRQLQGVRTVVMAKDDL